jgi:hypothetical protein
VIEHFPLDALRGQSVDIAGRLTDAAPGTRAVDVVLERSGEAPRALGTLAVGGNGEFAGVLSIPADVPPGDYALRAFAASW